MRRALACLAVGGLLAAPALADSQVDAVGWLQKMATAAQKLNYTGIFTYQSGGSAETSRITHLVDAEGEHERLEVLDGSPREVVRSNDEVKCFLPEDKVVIVEKRRQYKGFPALLPPSVQSLGENYQIRKGGTARVAGLDSQLIVLEPKDNLRYGHQLWAETNSGLLLKARMVNDRNEAMEQFTFSQIQIGGVIDRESLRARFATQEGGWNVHNIRTAQTVAPGDWVFRANLPGFRKTAGMKRQGARRGTETMHFVFSDGLAAISVFIEPIGDRPERADPATYSVGAINVYKRVAGQHLLTVLGEVPLATVKRLGDGIEPRKK